MAGKKQRKVEAVAREEATVFNRNDRVYSDDGRKLEPAENVGEPTPDADPDVPPGSEARGA